MITQEMREYIDNNKTDPDSIIHEHMIKLMLKQYNCRRGRFIYPNNESFSPMLDHTFTMVNKEARYIVTQPYYDGQPDENELIKIIRTPEGWELDEISYVDSWWYPGRTVLIIFKSLR